MVGKIKIGDTEYNAECCLKTFVDYKNSTGREFLKVYSEAADATADGSDIEKLTQIVFERARIIYALITDDITIDDIHKYDFGEILTAFTAAAELINRSLTVSRKNA